MRYKLLSAILVEITCGILLLSIACRQPSNENNAKMSPMNDQCATAFARCKDPSVSLSERISALEAIASGGDRTLVNPLRELLKRTPPEEPYPIKNRDRRGTERVVDLYIVKALNRLGCASENHRIADLVSHAGAILQEPDEEIRIAAKIVLDIGSTAIVGEIIDSTRGKNAAAVCNAVRALDAMRLPLPATGGATEKIIDPDLLLTFTTHYFKDEIETLARLSKGKVRLTPATNAYITVHNFDRGGVRRVKTSLREIIESDLDLIDLRYFQSDNSVYICTNAEAALRWQQWWEKNKHLLSYDRTTRTFILKI
jgi:hypothetical protein